jgi:tetratricopeptide (TPR) repeat protein
MDPRTREHLLRKLDEAEGYVLLELPANALEILDAEADWSPFRFESSYLRGEALRALGNYRAALDSLEAAVKWQPTDVALAVSLGWCYKRTHRLAQAIDSLLRALAEHDDEPILHYNLACYWSLAGNKPKAVEALANALRLSADFAERIETEADFDPIRDLPEFQVLVERFLSHT